MANKPRTDAPRAQPHLREQPHYEWVSPDKLTRPPIDTPIQMATLYVNCWWPVNEKGEVALYIIPADRYNRRVSPQCNADPRVLDKLQHTLPEAVDRIQIPLAMLTHSCFYD